MRIRLLLAAEAAVFGLAATIHTGALRGYAHARARNAETVIGAVLLAGLVLIAIVPRRLRTTASAVQGFAVLGTLVGLFTIAIGVGPRTLLDLVLHLAMLTLLTAGLLIARRTPVQR